MSSSTWKPHEMVVFSLAPRGRGGAEGTGGDGGAGTGSVPSVIAPMLETPRLEIGTPTFAATPLMKSPLWISAASPSKCSFLPTTVIVKTWADPVPSPCSAAVIECNSSPTVKPFSSSRTSVTAWATYCSA